MADVCVYCAQGGDSATGFRRAGPECGRAYLSPFPRDMVAMESEAPLRSVPEEFVFGVGAVGCPKCFSGAWTHSGDLHQPAPGGPMLEEPVELRRCGACSWVYRADGVAFDAHVSAAEWAEYRSRPASVVGGPFDVNVVSRRRPLRKVDAAQESLF
jgi:hypothetical protein